MSSLAFSSDHGLTRRVAVRRATTLSLIPPHTAAQAIPATWPVPARPETRDPKLSLLAAGLAILAVHLGIVYYVKMHPSHPATPVVAPPVTVELATPPQVIEPPKPLPQVQKKPVLPPPPLPRAQPVEPPKPQPAPEPAKAVEPTPAPSPVQAPPPPPAPAPVAQEPVTGAVGYAGYLSNPAPEYPQFAIDQGWEGTVLLSVHVLASGKPDKAEIKHSSGHKILDQVALNTVLRSWRFQPAHRGSATIDSWVDVPSQFKLN